MSWWRRLFRAGRMENELDAELRHHFDLMVAEKIRSGMTEGEARRSARLEFGGLEQVKGDCRESRGTMLAASIAQDLHFAVRQMRKNPGFATVMILTLALGIGATTAIFSIFNATLLRPLPYRDPGRLVILWSSIPAFGFTGTGTLTDPDFAEWKQQNQVFEDVAAYRGQTSNLTGSGIPERLQGVTATASLFPLLGATPELGRTFAADEQIPGHENVVVISHQLWARRFASDKEILGTAITLNGTKFNVLGVMPSGFQFPSEPDFWVPLVLTSDRSNATDQVIARLKPGITLQRVSEDIALIQQHLNPGHRHDEIHLSFVFLKDKIAANIRPALIVLLAAVGLLLLIACANVANLFLTRATARRQEIAMRRALGASRLRIVRQLLTESLLLAGIGGTVGVLMAVATRRLLMSLMPQSAPGLDVLHRNVTAEIDVWVLGFSFLIALTTGILFGLAPAFSISKADLPTSPKASGSTYTSDMRSRRIRNALVAGEFALTLVLLLAAGLLIESFVRLLDVNPGLDPRNVAIVNLELPETSYQTDVQRRQFHEAILDRIGALPGVRAAGTVGFGLPFGDSGIEGDFKIHGRSETPPDIASKLAISPDYFRAMGIPLIAGRPFDRGDTTGSQPVVIVSRSFAERFWPAGQAVGQQIQPGFKGIGWCSVVGVVGDVKQSGLGHDAPLTLYLPYSQSPDFLMSFMTIVVRTDGNPVGIVHAVRTQVQSVDPEIPVFDAASMSDLISKSVAQPRLNSFLLASFAALALILAAVGIYGVISYSVAQRHHEIGIRMALGAERHSMTRMVVREGAAIAFVGIAFGIGAGVAVSHLIRSFLYDVAPTDLATYCGVSVLLSVVALAACYIPARRAARVDPMVALRYE